MTLTYQYPVVYFYGDDEEDSEIVQKEGRIEPLKSKRLNFRHGYKNPRPHFCNRSTLIIHI